MIRARCICDKYGKATMNINLIYRDNVGYVYFVDYANRTWRSENTCTESVFDIIFARALDGKVDLINNNVHQLGKFICC